MVGDCGLVFPGADPGFQVMGDVLKKFRLAKRGATILGVFCVHIFSNFRGGVPGAPPPPP